MIYLSSTINHLSYWDQPLLSPPFFSPQAPVAGCHPACRRPGGEWHGRPGAAPGCSAPRPATRRGGPRDGPWLEVRKSRGTSENPWENHGCISVSYGDHGEIVCKDMFLSTPNSQKMWNTYRILWLHKRWNHITIIIGSMEWGVNMNGGWGGSGSPLWWWDLLSNTSETLCRIYNKYIYIYTQ